MELLPADALGLSTNRNIFIMGIKELSNLTHGITSLAGVFFLFVIWFCYYFRRVSQRKSFIQLDWGLPLLALAYMVWALGSFYAFFQAPNTIPVIQKLISTLNNALFLCSFSYFKHGFQLIAKLGRFKWMLFVFLISSTLFVIFIFENRFHPDVIFWLDFLFSGLTLTFLACLLALAFQNRGMSGLSVISIIAVFIELQAQYEMGKPNWDRFSTAVMFLVGHTMMLVILISLAFTWIIEDGGVLEKMNFRIRAEDAIRTGLNDVRSRAAFTEALEGLVRKAEIETVIDLLTKGKEAMPPEFGSQMKLDKITEAAAQFNNLKNLRVNGTISTSDYLVRYNQVVEFFMDIIKLIKAFTE